MTRDELLEALMLERFTRHVRSEQTSHIQPVEKDPDAERHCADLSREIGSSRNTGDAVSTDVSPGCADVREVFPQAAGAIHSDLLTPDYRYRHSTRTIDDMTNREAV